MAVVEGDDEDAGDKDGIGDGTDVESAAVDADTVDETVWFSSSTANNSNEFIAKDDYCGSALAGRGLV